MHVHRICESKCPAVQYEDPTSTLQLNTTRISMLKCILDDILSAMLVRVSRCSNAIILIRKRSLSTKPACRMVTNNTLWLTSYDSIVIIVCIVSFCCCCSLSLSLCLFVSVFLLVWRNSLTSVFNYFTTCNTYCIL